MTGDATVPAVALDTSEYCAVVVVPVTSSDKFQQFMAQVQFLDKVLDKSAVVQRQVPELSTICSAVRRWFLF